MLSSQELNDLYFISKLKIVITIRGMRRGIDNKKMEKP
jgi:hypothetical protein